MRDWTLLTWIKKAGDWDVFDARQLSGSDALHKAADLTEKYGEAESVLTRNGQTVSLTWQHDGVKTELSQQPCS